MITRSQTVKNQDQGDRRALKDVANRITPWVGIELGDNVANELDGGQRRYNLRPRKKVTETTIVDDSTHGQRSKRNGKKAHTKKQRRDAATPGRSKDSVAPHLHSSSSADDIDKGDSNDPQFATAYVNDMFEHFRSKESSVSAHPLYMEDQQDINEHMRSMLVNWLVEVHLKFKLVPETLYLTVNLLDRYLTKTQVTRAQLHLVGITTLWIASKYEEIWEVALDDCVHICEKKYTKQEILEMEGGILSVLDYRISIPSAHSFLVRYLRAGNADTRIVQLSYFILDGTLQSYHLLNFLPSQLAAAAVFIARKTAGRSPWSPTLLKYARYREEEVLPVARAVIATKVYRSAGLCAVDAKYARGRYGGISNVALCSDF